MACAAARLEGLVVGARGLEWGLELQGFGAWQGFGAEDFGVQGYRVRVWLHGRSYGIKDWTTAWDY